MQQVKWFERKFSFDPHQNVFPATLERLWGTPVRLRARIAYFLTSPAAAKIEGSNSDERPTDLPLLRYQPVGADGFPTWSIKENIGHLTDLEALWQGRLEDILAGRKYLREWDLENGVTQEANHNETALSRLVEDFYVARDQTMKRLRSLSETDLNRSALHPRLHQPLRLADLFHFVAEHDDHHLARISAIFSTNRG